MFKQIGLIGAVAALMGLAACGYTPFQITAQTREYIVKCRGDANPSGVTASLVTKYGLRDMRAACDAKGGRGVLYVLMHVGADKENHDYESDKLYSIDDYVGTDLNGNLTRRLSSYAKRKGANFSLFCPASFIESLEVDGVVQAAPRGQGQCDLVDLTAV